MAFSDLYDDSDNNSDSDGDLECTDYMVEDCQPGFTEKNQIKIDVEVRKRPLDNFVVHVNFGQQQKKPRLV